MPVRKITEQQFRTRRKDRKMVWVDAAALLVGLLVLSVSVGGIIVIEPEPEPIDWSYTFPEGKIAQKWCVASAAVALQAGCQQIDRKPTPEGQPVALLMDPVTAANVTEAVFHLSWTDDAPDTESQDSDEYGKRFTYDENSTDILRLDVQAPWGETFSAEGRNDLDLLSGTVEIRVNITQPPEPGQMTALEKQTVQRYLMQQHTVTEHKALGEWSATVTVVRAGDQNGTAPQNACTDVPPDVVDTLPPEVSKECYLEDNQNNAEDYGIGALPNYEATYDDTGNEWLLEFSVRTYSSSVSF